jgi:hypothetical protein
MPPWMEILINGIGYAGFIAVARYHKPSGESTADRLKRGANSPGAARRPCAPADRP